MGVATEADRAKVREAMLTTHVWDLRDRDFMQLSDGQRQRVLLARAICQEPRLLVLDEPTSHLDVHYQIELLGILRELVRTREVGVLMSLHELPLVWKVSDWVVCMRDGVVTAQGTPREMCTPEVIDALFDLEPGTFDPLTGMIELPERPAQATRGRR
jgi:iron complex transport system ATP-binding protein